MIKIKKGIPLYDQCDENGYWGKVFGSSYIPETLFQPLEDLSNAFEKLRKNKKFLKERDEMYAKFIGRPTPFLKLNNLNTPKITPNMIEKLILYIPNKYNGRLSFL